MDKRIAVLLVAMLVAGFLVGSLAGYGGASGQISTLQQQVSTLQTERTSLQNLISILQTNRTNLQSQVTTLQSQVSTLQNSKVALQDENDLLRSQLLALNVAITALEAQVAFLEQQLELQVLGVYFSPRGGCEAQVINWINRANRTIYVLIYSFTLDTISSALENAKARGVEIKIVFEKSQITQYSEYQRLKAAGISVRNDTNSDYMHNKVMIVDSLIVATGSFNWSAHAEEENNENLIIIKSVTIATTYETEFQKIWNTGI